MENNMKPLNLFKRGKHVLVNPEMGLKKMVEFEVGDKVRYIFGDDIQIAEVTIKFGQILTIKEVSIWKEKNELRYVVEVNGRKVGMRDFELELV